MEARIAKTGSMIDQPKRRPNRKRQLAGVLLVYLICYPLSLGPYSYALGRGWVPRWAAAIGGLYFYPALAVPAPEGRRSLIHDWHNWVVDCLKSGMRDRQRQ